MGLAVHNLTVRHDPLAAVAVAKSEREPRRDLTARLGAQAAAAKSESKPGRHSPPAPAPRRWGPSSRGENRAAQAGEF
jgi:hypothetical protein